MAKTSRLLDPDMDENEAYAIAYANLKGGKDKDVPELAKALSFIKRLKKYQSNDQLGKELDVSGEIIGEFLSYNKLPKKIQELFERKKLTQLEQLRKLSQLKRRYPDNPDILIEAANEISSLKSHDTRNVIEFLIKHPEKSAREAREVVLKSKTTIKHEYHVMTILSGDEYKMLSREAKKLKTSEASLTSIIVRDWLKSKDIR